MAAALVVATSAACSAGDAPDPDAARAARAGSDVATSSPGSEPDAAVPTDGQDGGDAETDGEEPELSAAEDATLDALEDQFGAAGVKDIRGAPGEPVTIRLDDGVDIAAAAQPCAAVRAAGFAEVTVDIDDRLEPCP